MSRPRYWLAGTLTACCLAISANAQVVSQAVNSVAVGGITGLGTGVATALGINVGTVGAPLVKGTSVCADLSNGATGCSTATGTSGATIPLLNGINTWSAVNTWTASDTSFGNGAGLFRILLNGTGSGSGGGSYFQFQGGGTAYGNIGNLSAIQGGTFSNTFQIHSVNSISIAGSGTTSCSTGLATASTGILSCVASSARFKNDITNLSESEAVATVMKLKPASWTYKEDSKLVDAGQPAVGFIAEDVFEVDPRLVGLDADGRPFVVRHDRMIGDLVSVIQQQQRRIEVLEHQR